MLTALSLTTRSRRTTRPEQDDLWAVRLNLALSEKSPYLGGAWVRLVFGEAPFPSGGDAIGVSAVGA